MPGGVQCQAVWACTIRHRSNASNLTLRTLVTICPLQRLLGAGEEVCACNLTSGLRCRDVIHHTGFDGGLHQTLRPSARCPSRPLTLHGICRCAHMCFGWEAEAQVSASALPVLQTHMRQRMRPSAPRGAALEQSVGCSDPLKGCLAGACMCLLLIQGTMPWDSMHS